PKMPPNSFVFFSREMYPKLKKENPELKFKDINTIVSRKWKELDEASKNVYKQRSQEARQKFMEE
ncbi:high mobility group box, partial [Lichtheimia hyalospora FSU 10163]